MWEIQKTESKLKRESEENLMKRLFTVAGTKLKETTGDTYTLIYPRISNRKEAIAWAQSSKKNH